MRVLHPKTKEEAEFSDKEYSRLWTKGTPRGRNGRVLSFDCCPIMIAVCMSARVLNIRRCATHTMDKHTA